MASKTVGVIFGKFYPLHLGHLLLIEKAVAQVDELHVFIGHETERDAQLFAKSHLPKAPSVQDRHHWLRTCFHHRTAIHIHTLDEAGIAFYPNGWLDWSNRVKETFSALEIQPTTIFTSEAQDAEQHQRYFGCDVVMIDVQRDVIPISATRIREAPYRYWHFMPAIVQSFFSSAIAIRALSSTERVVAQQLACLFNTDLITERSSAFSTVLSAHSNPFYLYLIDEKDVDLAYFDHIILFEPGSQLALLEQGIAALRPWSVYAAT